MDLWQFALPAPVALAFVALLGYIFGRRNSKAEFENLVLGSRELRRAKTIIRELEEISNTVRRDLATHQTSVIRFKERLAHLARDESPETGQRLAEEAERILKPTLRLSNQIAHAYDEIRHQTTLLMSFAEMRTDPLTGLSNRRALEETLNRMLAMQSRYNTVFGLAIVDLDHFKEINDQHGHLQGDRMLTEFARKLEETARETDLLTRYGGEEFVVIMPETDLEGCCVFAERLRKKTERELGMTISCGVSVGLDGDTIHSLLSRSDTALYSAKASGRNCTFRHTGRQIDPVTPQANGNAKQANTAARARATGEGERPLLKVSHGSG